MTHSHSSTPAVLQELAAQIPDEFQVLEFLGEGGHGVVLKAINKSMQLPVALKLLKTDGSDDMLKQVRRMQHEAKVLARLSHENVVKVFQMGTCKDGTPFLVCEFLDGITLAQYLMHEPQPSPRRILEIFVQILDALTCAHEHGLLHRDLKPSNVMLITDHESGDVHVKLLDFGIAREFDADAAQTLGLTRTSQISGSSPYMSPEQCKGERIDQRADLYSVACMLYECLSSAPPFQGETPMHTRYLQIHEEAQLPEDDRYAHTASRAAVYKLALKCLSKDRSMRPENAGVFKELLIKAMPAAAKRSSWTATKSKANSLLASSVLALTVIATTALLAGNNKIHELNSLNANYRELKETKAPSAHAHSLLVRLKNIAERCDRFVYKKTPDSLKEALGIHDQIVNCISEISRDDKGTSFIAWRNRARLEQEMGLLEESEKSWLEALSFCQDSEGKQTVEACECYDKLSRVALDSDKTEKSKLLAIQGLALVEQMRTHPKFLNIPPLIDIKDKLDESDLHMVLSVAYTRLGNFKSAEQEAAVVEICKEKQEKLVEASGILSERAHLKIRMGDLEGAKALIGEKTKEYYQFGDENPRMALAALEILRRSDVLDKFPAIRSEIRARELEIVHRSGLADPKRE